MLERGGGIRQGAAAVVARRRSPSSKVSPEKARDVQSAAGTLLLPRAPCDLLRAREVWRTVQEESRSQDCKAVRAARVVYLSAADRSRSKGDLL